MRRWLYHTLALIAACAVAEAQQTGESTSANPLARHELKDFAATLQRPLFAATRRPPAPAAAPSRETPPPPPPSPPSLTLVGVVNDEKGHRAIVETGLPAKVRSLQRGDEIEGWRVLEIAAQRIVFERNARIHAVALFLPRSHSSRIASTPPPPPLDGD
uniref:hypothetical protein n=1 Tax=unclassified Methylosinus TaxID=2624500 RepID=UPI000464E2FA|nr:MULTISPECIES: hypothetical protein [unclassified Methylosinus]OAI26233.1 hypothetical protein A1351_02035 [Methylosinus sp. R-45379]TDX60033.1 general secretion pathway protein N [Methylosinus sp. sav-2]